MLTINQKLKKLIPTSESVSDAIAKNFVEEKQSHPFEHKVGKMEMAYGFDGSDAYLRCDVFFSYPQGCPQKFCFRLNLNNTSELERASELFDLWDGGDRIANMIVRDLRDRQCWISREELLVQRLCGKF